MTLIHARPRLWNRDEFLALAEAGFLSRDERYELIEGEIVCMSPQGKKHRRSIILGNDLLTGLFRETHFVAVQVPLPLSHLSEPEPDFALIPKSCEELDIAGADLILEVANTSLLYDRTEKASLYARYGIADYWILNVADPGLEVRRDPVADPTAVHGWSYATVFSVGPQGSCGPLFAPGRQVAVADLLKINAPSGG